MPKVTVTIKGRKEPPPTARPLAPAKRYGPFSRPPDEDFPKKRRSPVSVTFLDLSAPFILRNVGTTGRKVLFYTQLRNETPLIDQPFKWTRADLESTSGQNTFTQPTLAPNEISVSDTVNGTYRQTFSRWPLPFLHADGFGLSFRLGATDHALADSNPAWQERPAENAAETAERAAAWSLADTTDSTSTGNTWHGWSATFRDEWFKNNARLYRQKPTSRRSTFRVDSLGSIPVFEDFDPFDTVNFKVTQGDYAAAEVAMPKIDAAGAVEQLVQVGLVPRFWAITGGFNEWAYFFDGVNPPALYLRTGTFSDEVLGITCPYVSKYFYNSSGINQVGYTVGTLDATTGIFTTVGHAPSTASFTAIIDGVPPQQAAFGAGSPAYSDDHTNFLMYLLAVIFTARGDAHITFSGDYPFDPYPLNSIIERSDATVDVEVAETPVGALVGRVRLRGELYNVYRKTANPGGQTIYSGGFDSLGLGSGWSNVTGGNYHNSLFNSFARTFGDYDPSTFVAHVTI